VEELEEVWVCCGWRIFYILGVAVLRS
jgi:hypothetical protein